MSLNENVVAVLTNMRDRFNRAAKAGKPYHNDTRS